MRRSVSSASKRQSLSLSQDWSLAPVAAAIQALRGYDFVASVSIVSEVGDFNRFAKPTQLMGFLGMTPSENSTGDSVRRGHITKAGNSRARCTLIESAWAYRFPARLGADKRAKIEALPKPVADIAWKAQTRLCARYRALTARGKTASRRRHRHRPRVGGLHLGHRPRGAAGKGSWLSRGSLLLTSSCMTGGRAFSPAERLRIA
jgi:hypothetical protein